MNDQPYRVDSAKIEGIVGVKRHSLAHYARAVSEERMVYILHSQACYDALPDLNCDYTLALYKGIDLEEWVGFEDQPVRVIITDGYLMPYDLVGDSR